MRKMLIFGFKIIRLYRVIICDDDIVPKFREVDSLQQGVVLVCGEPGLQLGHERVEG